MIPNRSTLGRALFAGVGLATLGCSLTRFSPFARSAQISQNSPLPTISPSPWQTPTATPDPPTLAPRSAPTALGWKGLGFDPEEWDLEPVLVLRALDTCVIRFRPGGRDFPESFRIDKERKRLGPHEFEVASLYYKDRFLNVSYWYVPPDGRPRGLGFEIGSSGNIDVCIEKAEALFSNLDPSRLIVPTGTPAG